ncbi:MAG: anaerobic ribonucleoside-triphosphate reductase activating protein [Clostridia bacterium]|nr:anaerobic ribonucleoside-triphosphate reductase activating protein [Clostridia bacterium]
MQIAGLQKLTLLDFPGYTACTVFTGGCNFRCPFCHNAGIVLSPTGNYSTQQIIDFLSTRHGKLDGVCITGGEPLLNDGIADFIAQIKSMGFLVKLDTNGSRYEKLKLLIESGVVDYVAMDIKNVPEKYSLSTGVKCNINEVLSSVELLKKGICDYEFRTTVVKQFNEVEDFKQIAEWLKGAKRYFLQQFNDSGNILRSGCSAYSEEEMRNILSVVKQNGLEVAQLRGV